MVGHQWADFTRQATSYVWEIVDLPGFFGVLAEGGLFGGAYDGFAVKLFRLFLFGACRTAATAFGGSGGRIDLFDGNSSDGCRFGALCLRCGRLFAAAFSLQR